MAITTTKTHVRSALDLKAQTAHFVFGRTSAWDNEQSPPVPEASREALDEVVGYLAVTSKSLCRPLGPNEESNYPKVKYNRQLWILVPDAVAYEENAVHVYYETTLYGEILPPATYRQIGIQLNLTPNSGVNKDNLRPNEVADAGILHCFENAEPINRTKDITITEKFITTVSGN